MLETREFSIAQAFQLLKSGSRSRRFQTESRPRKALDVKIVEVGPRNGFQNISRPVPTPTKIEFIRRLAATGLQAIEASSFASSRWIPQLADSQEVMKAVVSMQAKYQFDCPVLVPNMEGFDKGLQAGMQEAVVFVSASECSSWKNTNCSVEQALIRAEEIITACQRNGVRARGLVSAIFDCPHDGPTKASQVLAIAKRFLESGCYEVGLDDTLGTGTPADTERLLKVLLSEIPADKLAGSFHDTYGQAVANTFKSYEMGLRSFDGNVAGLGGCSYAQGATANAATEDLVYAFECAGVSTGVDLAQLCDVGDWISSQLKITNSSRAGTAFLAERRARRPVESVSSASPKSNDQSFEPKTTKDDGQLRVTREDNVVRITLTRPKNGNALTNDMLVSMTEIFTTLANDQQVFQIVLEAEGKFFCTGMDLSTSSSSSSSDPEVKAEYYDRVEAFFNAIQNSPQTTIAVIDQPCYGGGVGLAFCFDIRLCSSNASFTMTEIKLGLSPAVISRQIIREWGIPFAREAMLSGRTVSPAELQTIGAVHGIAKDSEELHSMATEYLNRLKGAAPRSAKAIKQLTRLAWKYPGGPEQDRFIKETFKNMMTPGSEGEHGILQFQKKIKGIDWSDFWNQKYSKERT